MWSIRVFRAPRAMAGSCLTGAPQMWAPLLAHTHVGTWASKSISILAPLLSLSSGGVGRAAPPQKVDTEVLIVGGGPVGLSLSILLSQLGVSSLLVEKRAQPMMHPQAHFINNRTMEIFRQMNGVAAEIESTQPPLEEWRKFIYCHSMTGTVLGEVDHFAEQTGRPNLSLTSVAHFSQNKLVPLLMEKARMLGNKEARPESVKALESRSNDNDQVTSVKTETVVKGSSGAAAIGQILEGYTCIDFETATQGVTASLVPIETPLRKGSANRSFNLLHPEAIINRTDEVERDPAQVTSLPSMTVHSEYLVAADGASSGIRSRLGISLEGDGEIESLLSVHFTCKGLHERLKGRQAMLYFVFNQEVIVVVVAHDLKKGEFVAQIPYYPPQQNPEEFTPQVCRDMIQKAIGAGDWPVVVQSIRPWTMTAQVAERYCAGDGRVFLVGDAAHRFPPAGGFGMNTGIQDAHNLAWKLAAVLRGASNESLLQTYEQERRPIAEANTALSVSNFKGAVAIPSALGLDPAAAKLLLRTLNRPPISLLPASYQRQLLEQGLALGRAQMSPLLLNASNPIGRARLAEVARIIRDGESLQLQFPAEDLGFRYTQGAVWTGVPDVIERAEREKAVGRGRGYVPDTRPGCRLPHCELAVGRIDTRTGGVVATQRVLSTLDLVNGGNLRLRLLVSADVGAVKWKRALEDIRSILPYPIQGATVWPAEHAITDANEITGNVCEESRHVQSCTIGEGQMHLVDVQKGWAAVPGVGPGVVLLVRPDGHIAWRSTVDDLREFAEVNEGGVLQDIFSVRHQRI